MPSDSHALPEIVSRDEWLDARRALLAEEKALSRQRDAVARARRALPAVALEEDFRFVAPSGEEVGLDGLFGPHSQLLLYHFMFDPGWERPCKSCSFWADHFTAMVPHLARRDVAFAASSLAPREKLDDWAARAGWRFPWFSTVGTAFNEAFDVTFPREAPRPGQTHNFRPAPKARGEMPGLSTFLRTPDGRVLHHYSAYARGLEPLNATYGALDLVPRGRDEADLAWSMEWVRRQVDVEEGYEP